MVAVLLVRHAAPPMVRSVAVRAEEARPHPRPSSPKVLLRIVVCAALAAGVAFVVHDEPTPGRHDVTSVLRGADRLIGQRVTVTGRVAEVLSAKSLTITDDGGDLLVLDISVIPAIDNDLDGVVANDRVEVSGMLRRFAIEDVERYVGELNDQRYETFVGKPVILAESFRPL